MIVSESAISLSSQHTAVEEYQQSESLTIWTSGENPSGQPPQNNPAAGVAVQQNDMVSLSAESVRRSAEVNLEKAEDGEIMGDLNIRLLKALIERLTGRRVQTAKPIKTAEQQKQPVEQSAPAAEEGGGQGPGFGLIYDYHESYYEAETTSFSANGVVATSDGVEVEIDVAFTMSREFYEEHSVNIRMGEALKDPLVLNFSGTAAELTETKFTFDIDSNGSEETMSFVTPDSGFLALDSNGDGIINNGRELFGAETGDGFAELARYDDDGNGWIDEQDGVYEDLRVWVKDGEGNDTLFTLAQKNVGALYLGNAETTFALKDDTNSMHGQITNSGIYLREDYTAGTIQKLDLVV